MAELADAHGSGPCDGNIMRVQVSFPALEEAKTGCLRASGFLHVTKNFRLKKSAPRCTHFFTEAKMRHRIEKGRKREGIFRGK